IYSTLGRFHWVRWTRRKLFRIRFERLHDFRNTALELRIAAGNHRCRIVFHDNIGIDAVSFDDVFPIDRSRGKLGHEDCSAIKERTPASNANHAAPSALADQRPESRSEEHTS